MSRFAERGRGAAGARGAGILLALFVALALAPVGSAAAAKCTQKGTKGVDLLKGTKKKDVLCGKGGDDILIGKGGADKLKGGGGDDILTGKAGNDKLNGGPGNDTLTGGPGRDAFNGQGGVDVAAFADLTAPVKVDLEAGTATGEGADSLTGVENVIGSSFDDTLVGDGAPNELSGGDGNDVLLGGGGDDALRGQGGVDSTDYSSAGGPVSVDLRAGTVSGAAVDSISGIEDITGTSGDDTFVDDSANNRFNGAGGTDTVSFAGASGAIDADLAGGVAGGDGNDVLVGIENLRGSANDDRLAGDGARNSLDGAGGDDTLLGRGGDDALAGGAGSDTADYQGSSGAVSADLRAGSVTGQGTDSLDGVENLTGSPFSDTLAGDAGPNRIDGGGGADTVSYAASPSAVDVNLVSQDELGDGHDTLIGIDNVIGSAHDDTITANDNPNAIAGGAGDDLISALGGDDHVSGQAGDDGLFGDDDDDVLSGGPDDDHIDGGAGTNQCDGGTGVNTFAGNCDSTAPALVSLGISPSSIDTSAAAGQVDFTLSVTDDAAGVDPAASRVIVHGPGGQPTFEIALTQAGGDPLAGDYTASLTLPQYSPQGTWTVEVQLADTAGNAVLLTSAQLAGDGQPNQFSQDGVGDLGGPTLTTFDLAPTSIDTFAADRDVTFDLDAVDDLSGIDEAASRVLVFAPAGNPSYETPLQLQSGTATDGHYQQTITIPRYSASGTWKVELQLVDNAGYRTIVSSGDLAAASLPSSFEQTGQGDGAPPDLGGFSLSPPTVDTSRGGAVVSFALAASDSLSGVDVAASHLTVYDPVDQAYANVPLTSAGGGAYTAALNLPQGSAPGIWDVEVHLVDVAGNERVVTPAQLAAGGYPSGFQNLAPSGT